MSKLFLFFSISITALTAGAQSPALLRGANTAFESGDYYNAALRYEEYLGFRKGGSSQFMPYAPQLLPRKGAADSKALQQLAEAYRRLPDYAAAEKYYALLNKDQSPSTDARIAYAGVLRANGKGKAAAAPLLMEVLKRTDLTDAQRSAGEAELKTIQFGEAQLASPDAKAITVSEKNLLNKGAGNYAAVAQSGSFYFTSTRKEDSSAKGGAINQLYQQTAEAATALKLLDKDLQAGTLCLSVDGRSLYFTAWTGKGATLRTTIYKATKNSEGWSEPQALSSSVNAAGSNNRQPWLATVDGRQRLYFSSDRTGGQGGYDIWYAALDADGEVGAAVNAGSLVNTASDEGSPFYHQPTNTLVFASNGHPGMGGFDLYTFKENKVVNMGYPVNSVRDDLYFFSSSDSLLGDAMLSSDRSTDCCLEIFAVSKKPTPKAYQHWLEGTLRDCATGTALTAANVTVNGVPVETDANGHYRLSLSKAGASRVSASMEAYTAKDTTITTTIEEADQLWTVDLCLDPVSVASPARLPIVLFLFDQAALTQYGRRQLDSLAMDLLANPAATVLISGYTDARGSEGYNTDLAEKRALSCKAYLVKKGVAAERLTIEAKGECCPVAPDKLAGRDHPDGRQLNRRVEIKITR